MNACDELPKTNHVPSFTVSASDVKQDQSQDDSVTPFTLMVAATDEVATPPTMPQPQQAAPFSIPSGTGAIPAVQHTPTPTFGIPTWALNQHSNSNLNHHTNQYTNTHYNQDIAATGAEPDQRTVLDTLRLRGALGVVSIGLPLPKLAEMCLSGFAELVESENGCHAFNCIFAKGMREKQLPETLVNRLAERVIAALPEVMQHRWKHCLPERTLPHPLMLHAIRKDLHADAVLGSRHFSERWNHSKASRILDAYMSTEDIREIARILEVIFSLPESIMLQVFTNHALQKAGSRLRVGAGELNTGKAVAPSSPSAAVPTFKKLQEMLLPQLAILSRDQKVYWNICQSWELEVGTGAGAGQIQGQNHGVAGGFYGGGRGAGRGGSRRFDGGYGPAYNTTPGSAIPPPPPFHQSPAAHHQQHSPQQMLAQGNGPQFACTPPSNVNMSSPGSLQGGTPGGLSVSPGSFQFVSMPPPPPPPATSGAHQQQQQLHVLQPSSFAGKSTSSPGTLNQQYVLVQPSSSRDHGTNSNNAPQMVLVQQPPTQPSPSSQASPAAPFVGLPSPGSVGGPWAPINN